MKFILGKIHFIYRCKTTISKNQFIDFFLIANSDMGKQIKISISPNLFIGRAVTTRFPPPLSYPKRISSTGRTMDFGLQRYAMPPGRTGTTNIEQRLISRTVIGVFVAGC